jgi:hypothetical protein
MAAWASRSSRNVPALLRLPCRSVYRAEFPARAARSSWEAFSAPPWIQRAPWWFGLAGAGIGLTARGRRSGWKLDCAPRRAFKNCGGYAACAQRSGGRLVVVGVDAAPRGTAVDTSAAAGMSDLTRIRIEHQAGCFAVENDPDRCTCEPIVTTRIGGKGRGWTAANGVLLRGWTSADCDELRVGWTITSVRTRTLRTRRSRSSGSVRPTTSMTRMRPRCDLQHPCECLQPHARLTGASAGIRGFAGRFTGLQILAWEAGQAEVSRSG